MARQFIEPTAEANLAMRGRSQFCKQGIHKRAMIGIAGASRIRHLNFKCGYLQNPSSPADY